MNENTVDDKDSEPQVIDKSSESNNTIQTREIIQSIIALFVIVTTAGGLAIGRTFFLYRTSNFSP